MYTLRTQPIFNPMQTTLFKRAHTGTCMENGYDINSMAALTNLFKLNNQHHLQENKDELTNQNIVSNLVSNAGSLPTDTLQTSSTVKSTGDEDAIFDKLTYDKLQALTYYQQLNQLPTALFNLQNSATFDLARAIQLATELSSSQSFNQSSLQSLIKPSAAPSSNTIQASAQSSSRTSSTASSRPTTTKRQKTTPNPIQLTYSTFNHEQVQPLDLSVKSASSTASERFILEPLNLSRSNSPEEMEKASVVNSVKIDELKSNLVQIQNALCKKKIMMQRELIKKSSCSSAPCSPSSIATSSSPSDQPFDLDTSQSNQSNLEICLPLNETVVQHLKKRKFSDSCFSMDSQNTNHSTNSLPKLQAKRRLLNRPLERKRSVPCEESFVCSTSNQPSTIIIDAKNTFTCSICGEMFAFKDRLSKHIKSKHRSKIEADNLNNQSATAQTSQQSNGGRNSPNQRNYQCTICNRSFSRSDMLTRHSRVHSGLKPYTCNICNSEFTRSDHLATHKRTHSGEKPYKCSKCTYTACRRDMITRHMKTHNGDKNSKASNSVVLLIPTAQNLSPSPEIVTTTSQTNSSANSNNEFTMSRQPNQLDSGNEMLPS